MDRVAIIAAVVVVILIVLIFWRRMEGFTMSNATINYTDPNVVPRPLLSYYRKYDESDAANDNGDKNIGVPGKIVVGYHYAPWCGYCQAMTPVWNQVKQSLSGQAIVFLENNEDKAPTPGITGLPTIIRYQYGKAREYKGRAVYDDLRTWILNSALPYPD